MADGAPASAGLPSSNRGVSFLTISPVIVDWCTVACDLTAILEHQGWDASVRDVYLDLDGEAAHAPAIASAVFAFLFAGTSMRPGDEVRGARFYACSVEIQNSAGDYVGCIQFGGPHTLRKDGTRTVRVELTGDGCRYFEAGAGGDHAKRWLALQAKLESVGGRLTRCDLAFDDLKGEHSVKLAESMWETGDFNSYGQRPKARLFDDKDTGDGKTFYVGAPTSEKQMRVYEKGRELGDKLSEWVRWEIQFKASNRKPLPLDMLSNCEQYMRGAYPALTFIQAVFQKIDYVAQAAISTAKSALRHVRRQYGATLGFVAKHFPADEDLARFVRTLTRNKLPAWAHQPMAANTWPGLLAHATT